MAHPSPAFFTRLALAVRTFFAILGSSELAARIGSLPESSGATEDSAGAIQAPSPDSALQLLALLQRDGRLIDFLEEDVAQYSDADIGAAVRVVHEGCRKVLREHFTIMPVFDQPEGERVRLEPGFDATAIRPTGNLVGEPPFTGTLAHRGWRATGTALPKLTPGHDTSVLAPAEVEL